MISFFLRKLTSARDTELISAARESEKEADIRFLAPWMLRLMICPFNSSFCSFSVRLSWNQTGQVCKWRGLKRWQKKNKKKRRRTGTEGNFRRYLFESFDLVFQFGFTSPGLILLQAGGGGSASLRFSLQLVQLKVLKLLPQVFYELWSRRETLFYDFMMLLSVWWASQTTPTSWVLSFSFWFWWRSWLSLSAIFLRDSVSSISRSDIVSTSSCSFLFSWKIINGKTQRKQRWARGGTVKGRPRRLEHEEAEIEE